MVQKLVGSKHCNYVIRGNNYDSWPALNVFVTKNPKRQKNLDTLVSVIIVNRFYLEL